MLGLVRQHRRPGDVADGPDALDVGGAVFVDDDRTALGLHADGFEANTLDVALDANGRDQLVAADLLLGAVLELHMSDNTVTGLVDLGHLGFGQELDTALLEPLAGECGNLRVLHRQDLWQQFDDGDLGAERAVE